MTSRHRGVGTPVVIIVVIVVVIVTGVIGYGVLATQTGTPIGGTMALVNTSTQQNDFTLDGPVPLVTITPQNSTFTLTYTATTLGSPVISLSFNLSQSYVTIYTNGTEWVPYSQACSSILESSSSDESVPSQASYSVSVITVSGPCYSQPAPGWIPVNGTAVNQYEALTGRNSSQVELSVTPTTTPVNQTVSLLFTITLNLKPGIYVIGLALGVQTTNAYGGFFEYSDLNPLPVIVKS